MKLVTNLHVVPWVKDVLSFIFMFSWCAAKVHYLLHPESAPSNNQLTSSFVFFTGGTDCTGYCPSRAYLYYYSPSPVNYPECWFNSCDAQRPDSRTGSTWVPYGTKRKVLWTGERSRTVIKVALFYTTICSSVRPTFSHVKIHIFMINDFHVTFQIYVMHTLTPHLWTNFHINT